MNLHNWFLLDAVAVAVVVVFYGCCSIYYYEYIMFVHAYNRLESKMKRETKSWYHFAILCLWNWRFNGFTWTLHVCCTKPSGKYFNWFECSKIVQSIYCICKYASLFGHTLYIFLSDIGPLPSFHLTEWK